MELRQSSCFRKSSAESMGSPLLVAVSEDGFSFSAANEGGAERGAADNIKTNPSLLILLDSEGDFILGLLHTWRKTNGAPSRDLLGPTFAGRPSIRNS